MRLWNWEVWPWNWRKVRKADISKEDRDLFERYGEDVIRDAAAGNIVTSEHEINSLYPRGENPGKVTEARKWLTERGDAHERREQRIESVEVGVVALITIEILLSLYFGLRAISDGGEQAAILRQMNKNTEDTALQIQRAADAMSATLQVIQADRADRLAQLGKKPRLVLYAGNLPLTKPHGPVKPTNETETSAVFELVLRNDGDAAAHQIIFRVLMPRDAATAISSSGFSQNLPGYFLGDGETVAYQWRQDSLWPRTFLQISVTVSFQKGCPPFQLSFHADANEITTDTPLGVLTVSPRTSAN